MCSKSKAPRIPIAACAPAAHEQFFPPTGSAARSQEDPSECCNVQSYITGRTQSGSPMIRRSKKPAFPVQQQEERTMEAYHIDRFGSVDGIVLQSERGPPARTEGDPDASARELA